MLTSKQNTLTFHFENCESLTFEITKEIQFVVLEENKTRSLDHKTCKMEDETYVSRGYVMLKGYIKPLSVNLFEAYNNPLHRLEEQDICQISLHTENFIFDFGDDPYYNENQKTYVTKQGNILIDWGKCYVEDEEDLEDTMFIVDYY